MIARLAARVIAVGLLVAAVAVVAAPAHAHEDPTPTTGAPNPSAASTAPDNQPHVELTNISPFTTLGGTVSLGLRLSGPLQGLELRVTAFSAVPNRSTYERTIDGKNLGSVLGTENYDIGALTTQDGLTTLKFGIQDPAAPRDPNQFSLRRTGVFPLKVDLVPTTVGAATLDGFLTHLVVTTQTGGVATPIGEPLQVAWVWPIVAPSARLANGQPDPAIVPQLLPDGRLGRIARALPEAATLPLTLELGPETVQSWGQIAANDQAVDPGIKSIESLAGAHQVLVGPYVPLDVPSLQAAGLGGEVPAQLAEGSKVLTNALGTTLDGRTTAVSPLDDGTLQALHAAGVDRLVLTEGELDPRTAQTFTPAQPFTIQSGDQRYDALSSDDGLVALLNGEGSAALRAQRLLAGLAVVALEQPNARRGVALVMPTTWSPSTALLQDVVGGLENNPFLHAATVDQVMDRVPAETKAGVPVVRRLAPVKPGRAPVTAAQLADARSKLASFQTLVGAGDSKVQAAEHAQLVSVSSQWKGAAGQAGARAELTSIDQDIGTFATQIQIPTDRTFTLTARRDTIPLSFKNLSAQPITVRVHLDSDRLRFPDGADQQLVLLPGTTTVGKFAIETRTGGPGTVPLHLTVTSADGTLVLQSSTLNVRSTVVNGVGLFLTVAAVAFLALWWLIHFRRRRRTKRAPAAVPAPVHQPA